MYLCPVREEQQQYASIGQKKSANKTQSFNVFLFLFLC